jgi:hypothetical protein
VSEEALQVPLRDAAADRVRGERVLRTLVEFDVREARRLDSLVPDILERLVGQGRPVLGLAKSGAR